MLNVKGLLLTTIVLATTLVSMIPSASADGLYGNKQPKQKQVKAVPTAMYEFSAKPGLGFKFKIKSFKDSRLCMEVDFTKINVLAQAEYLKVAPCRDIQEQYFTYGDNNMILIRPNGGQTWNDEYLTLDLDYTQIKNNPLASRVKLLKAFNRPEQQVVLTPVTGGYTMEFGHVGNKYMIDADVTKIGVLPMAHVVKVFQTKIVNPERTWIIEPVK
jgi:hypothetical protein